MEEKRGTMKIKKNIRAAFCFLAIVLTCGCADEGATVVIRSADFPEGDFASGGGGAEGSLEGAVYGGQENETLILVYVCGAVMCPGVVAVPRGSRAEDALAAAGGFSEDAGRCAVNLADWVVDGQMLYFPTQEEAREMEEAESRAGSGLVNINTADASRLCTLPGIGEGRARDIIAYREANGSFENCEDIMKVSGIKTSVYEKICDMITVR